MQLLTSKKEAQVRDRALYDETWRLATRDKDYVILRGPDAVGVLIVDYPNQRFALVRQPRPAINDPALREVVAGKIDVPGEDALQTAQRELAEEAGLSATQWRLVAKNLAISPGHDSELMTLYIASGLSPVPSRAADAHITIDWYVFNELDGLIQAVASDENTDAKTLIALMLLKLELLGS